MKLLINITDVRKYRQLSKQTNQVSFNGYIREVQTNELTELLGGSLMYDFMNYLTNDWTLQGGVFERNSNTEFTAKNTDLSAWIDYAVRMSNGTYLIITKAVFDGTDTKFTVTGNNLTNSEDADGNLLIKYIPDTISNIEYKINNDYIKLLNGTVYQDNAETIQYSGLRPFIIWKFLSTYGTVGGLKYSDVGGISISSDAFKNPAATGAAGGRKIALQNAAREENRISKYLNTNATTYPLWSTKDDDKNILNTEMIII